MLLLVLEEGPDGAVDDAFWRACGAARVEDVDRMVGGELLKGQFRVWR